jgi:hypothetical protein
MNIEIKTVFLCFANSSVSLQLFMIFWAISFNSFEIRIQIGQKRNFTKSFHCYDCYISICHILNSIEFKKFKPSLAKSMAHTYVHYVLGELGTHTHTHTHECVCGTRM